VLGLLAALFLGTGQASAQPQFDDLTADEQAKVDRDEIVVHVERTEAPLKHFEVIGLLHAPLRRAYAVFTDFDHYAEIFRINECHVAGRHGNRLAVHAIVGAPWPIGDRWVLNRTIVSPETDSFTFDMEHGNIAVYNGYVRLVARGPATSQVFYVARVDPGIPFLPKWIVNQFQASALPDTVKHAREYLKAHP